MFTVNQAQTADLPCLRRYNYNGSLKITHKKWIKLILNTDLITTVWINYKIVSAVLERSINNGI